VGSFLAVYSIKKKAKKTYQVYSTTTCPTLSPGTADHRYAYQIESNRYFELKLRPPRAIKRKPTTAKQKADRAEDELKANLYSLTIAPDDAIQESDVRKPLEEEEEDSFRMEDIPIKMELPARRFNAALAVGIDDKLYIYGGTYENPGRGEMTLDDFHVIDLGKLDGVRELWNRTTTKAGEDEDSSTDDDNESDTDDDQEMEDINDNENPVREQEEKMDIDIPSQETVASGTAAVDTAATSEATTTFNPKYPQPLPFESLKSFYDRTAKEWILLNTDRSKAARREAFIKAEGYWWECREEIREIEERMEESGVKEVVAGQLDRKEKRR
jgi:Domain of unknown function (DUF4110)